MHFGVTMGSVSMLGAPGHTVADRHHIWKSIGSQVSNESQSLR
jgi:hypothetical protein